VKSLAGHRGAWESIGVAAVSSPKRKRAPVDVFKYRDYREFLGTYYAQGKASGLSYRAFAKAAGFSAPNYLKLVIEGSRNLSKEMAVRFAQACKLNPEAAQYFCLLVEFNQASSDAERNALHLELTKFARFRAAQRLDLAQKDYHSSWFIPVVRELVACPGFQENPSWIAERLHPSISSKRRAAASSCWLKATAARS
jgi:uncharacterized protein (TIGR02147 family)